MSRYWPWLGGVLLIFVSVGFIGGSLVNELADPAGVKITGPEATQASQAAQGFAHNIPGGHTGKAAAQHGEPDAVRTGQYLEDGRQRPPVYAAQAA